MTKYMRLQTNLKKLTLAQQGIVSIVVTVILMIVITLIVLSFAKISRREQRNALDRQLSTQAFYASEGGVNDAINKLKGPVDTSIDYLNTCGGFMSAPSPVLSGNLNGSTNAKYTCLLVDPTPPSIAFTASDTQHVFPLEEKFSANISTMEVYWDDASGSSSFGGCPSLNTNPASFNSPPLASACNAPLLRVELVDSNTLTVSKVFFLYPGSTDTGLNFTTNTSGSTGYGKCPTVGAPNKCKATITLGALKYFVRLKSIYKPAAITVTANGGGAQLKGAQAIIDSTGKASDVERRIQVRVSLGGFSSNVPLYGIEGTGKVCKKFYIDGTNAIDTGSCSGSFPD